MDQGIIASFKLQYRKLWITFILREYEADKNPQKTVNLLRAVQQVQAAWEISVTINTIQRYQQKSTLIKKLTPQELTQIAQITELKGDTIVIDNRSTDRIEIRDQIVRLLFENLLSLDEFLNPEDETIVDKNEDIFASIVNHYAITRLGKEEESSDKEEIEEIDTAEALRAIKTVKIQKLQKGDSQDLRALDRVTREIVRYKSSVAHQTTIHRFFQSK